MPRTLAGARPERRSNPDAETPAGTTSLHAVAPTRGDTIQAEIQTDESGNQYVSADGGTTRWPITRRQYGTTIIDLSGARIQVPNPDQPAETEEAPAEEPPAEEPPAEEPPAEDASSAEATTTRRTTRASTA